MLRRLSRFLLPPAVLAVFLAVLVVSAVSSTPSAADPAPSEAPVPSFTREDARVLALAAAEVVAERGVDEARLRFHEKGRFLAGPAYVNVIDSNGTWLVYPPNPKNEGKSVLNVKDADGKLLVREILRVAQEDGKGWVSYRWLNPQSNTVESKTTYVVAVKQRDAVVYVGAYEAR